MWTRSMGRTITLLLGAGVAVGSGVPAGATRQRIERHFPVNGRPVVVIQNVANGRIEVKSSKNPEVVVIANETSNKVGFEMEQAGDRVDVTASILDASAQPLDLETSWQLTVPEETELQLKTENGLIYVEQVMGDMTLESVAGVVRLVEGRFSGNESLARKAQTATGTVDNQAAAFLRPDSHGTVGRLGSKFKGLFSSFGAGLAKVELSTYGGTIRILQRD